MAETAKVVATASHAPLTPYAPTVAIDWLTSEPDVRHRRLDASLVFVDISGFTALSERLASFGREGAEEITELLQQVFTQLLSVAYANAGSLLKFGGDALLLLFHGDDHAPRAACSADGMRRELARIGPLDSLAGPVRLGMSGGAHSGEVDLFLVGSSHRELLVTGPAASRVVELESGADTGEVLVSPELAARVDQGWLGALRDRSVELASTTDVHETDRRSTTGPGQDASLLIPSAIRRYLHAGGAGAEHRHAVVAFVAYHGTDRLLQRAGPGACAQALEDLVTAATDVADAHEITFLGSDVAKGGGKLILVAGAPIGHDDDLERILRASRALVATPSPFTLRVGVNPGPLFSGVVGPPYRLTYTVMGDTVNLAARLAYQAGDGEVIAPLAALERTRSRFDAVPVPPFHVKGKTDPIEAAVVGAPHDARVDARDRLPLLGRDEELDRLERLLAETARGGRIVEVAGPAGIGKSRLLRAFRDAHPERRLYYASCTSYEQTTPFYPFRGLLRHLLQLTPQADAGALVQRLQVVDASFVPWAALIGSVVNIETPASDEVAALDPRFRPVRLRTEVARLLRAMVPDTTILRIEDIHWIDEASRGLLDHLLTSAVPETSWLVVLTSREAGASGHAHERIELEPLGTDAVERLAQAAAERGLVQLDVAVQLAERAAGNPLFLQELLAFATESSGDEVPDSIERLIAARLDQLAPTHRDLLRHAALLGQRFDLSLLRSITGEQVAAADLDVLEEYVRREEPGEYRFQHDLYREVAYQALPFRLRRELHDRAARVIETRHLGRTDDVAEILALHYYRAGRHDQAYKHNLVAAERASRSYANADAVRFYRWALDSGTRSGRVTDADRLTLWTRMADLLELAGAYEEAEKVLSQARRVAPADRRPPLWFRSGVVRERQGRYPEALRWYGRTGRALVGVDDPAGRELRTRARLRSVETHIRQGRPAAVRRSLELLEEARELGSDELLARAHFVCGWALRTGSQADEHRRAALELYRSLDDLLGQSLVENELGISAYYRGDWTEALARYEAGRQLNDRLGDQVRSAVTSNNIGEILSDQGRSDEAIEAFTRCLRVARATGYAIAEGVATSNLGRAESRRGAFALATVRLEEAAALFARIGAAEFERDVRIRQAELALFQHDAELAAELARPLADDDRGGAPTVTFALRVLGCALWLQGDHESSLARLDAAVETAVSAGLTYDAALGRAARALVTAAEDDLEAATRVCRGLGVVVPIQHQVLGPFSPRDVR